MTLSGKPLKIKQFCWFNVRPGGMAAGLNSRKAM